MFPANCSYTFAEYEECEAFRSIPMSRKRMIKMFREKKKEEKTVFQDAPDPAEDACPLCGSKGRPLFDEYLECINCRHIFVKGKGHLEKKQNICPACGSTEYSPLFGDEVECKKCGYVYKSR